MNPEVFCLLMLSLISSTGHQVFNVRSMKRTLVIGDIHGALKALLQVFERARITADDKLIFLGDYVDGWSESAQVLDY